MLSQRTLSLRTGMVQKLPNMVLELRTESFALGCDGFTRYRDRVSVCRGLPVLDKVCTVRCG